MSNSNALRIHSITPFQEGPSWEDWDAIVRKKHPVRWFVNKTIPEAFDPAIRAFEDAWYWLQCHTRRDRRYHLVDLRGVDPLSNYTHGWLDADTVIELSAWQALRRYIEKEKPTDPASFLTPEELENEGARHQKEMWDEAHRLYNWWVHDRLDEKKKQTKLLRASQKAKKALDKTAYDLATEAWNKYRKECEAVDDANFKRLVEIRKFLWT